jgi:hypothetical protein
VDGRSGSETIAETTVLISKSGSLNDFRSKKLLDTVLSSIVKSPNFVTTGINFWNSPFRFLFKISNLCKNIMPME